MRQLAIITHPRRQQIKNEMIRVKSELHFVEEVAKIQAIYKKLSSLHSLLKVTRKHNPH